MLKVFLLIKHSGNQDIPLNNTVVKGRGGNIGGRRERTGGGERGEKRKDRDIILNKYKSGGTGREREDGGRRERRAEDTREREEREGLGGEK